MQNESEFREHRLELRVVNFCGGIDIHPRGFRFDPEIEVREHAHRLAIEMKFSIYGTELRTHRYEYRHPATWLDAARIHFAGRWWARAVEYVMAARWDKPKWETHVLEFSMRELFPDIAIVRDHHAVRWFDTPKLDGKPWGR